MAKNKALIYEHMPELVPIIKEWYALGMIDGWRGVSVKLVDGQPGEGILIDSKLLPPP